MATGASLQPVLNPTSGASAQPVSNKSLGSTISCCYQRLNEDSNLMLYKVTPMRCTKMNMKGL